MGPEEPGRRAQGRRKRQQAYGRTVAGPSQGAPASWVSLRPSYLCEAKAEWRALCFIVSLALCFHTVYTLCGLHRTRVNGAVEDSHTLADGSHAVPTRLVHGVCSQRMSCCSLRNHCAEFLWAKGIVEHGVLGVVAVEASVGRSQPGARDEG